MAIRQILFKRVSSKSVQNLLSYISRSPFCKGTVIRIYLVLPTPFVIHLRLSLHYVLGDPYLVQPSVLTCMLSVDRLARIYKCCLQVPRSATLSLSVSHTVGDTDRGNLGAS
ncbi:unnamed protein product [Protopolystoma xenopodis]|uniref:Uncharacterized protein n=1 Tax=Protopolystoma xenopodis TaxID=117903 RepID=A0A3S5AMC6_9PLAT|nr:unnamed protein product [Protopolystoma xenopodis]